MIFKAAWWQQNLTVLAGHHRQRTAWSGTAGGMQDGRWADPPDAPAATASGASARQQGFATAPLGVSNLATVTFSGWCCRGGERCRQPRRVARCQATPTSNSLRSGRPHDNGPDAALDFGGGSQPAAHDHQVRRRLTACSGAPCRQDSHTDTPTLCYTGNRAVPSLNRHRPAGMVSSTANAHFCRIARNV